MKPNLTWWSWEKTWNDAKFEIFFNDIKPKYFSFWKQNLVLLSSGHLTLNSLNFFLSSFVCCNSEIKFLWCQHFKCYGNPGWHPAFAAFIVPWIPQKGYIALPTQYGFYEQKFCLRALSLSREFSPSVCFLYTQQNSGFPGMRMTIPKGANARDNNVQEWAWCSRWNTHQEISHNALVLYI